MKHTLFLMALAALGTLTAPAALDLPEAPAAKQQGKIAEKPVLILWYGADWQPDAAAIEAQWTELAKAGLPVVLGKYNDALGTPWDTRQRALPVSTYNAPIGILLTHDGLLIATYPGKVVRDAAATKAAVEKTLAIVPEFVKQLDEARAHTGVPAAEAAGKALSLLAPADAEQHGALKTIITTHDPADVTGYKAEFCTDHLAMYADINRILRGGEDGKLTGAERDFAAAQAYVEGVLAKRTMYTEKRQQWLCGLAYIHREKFTSSSCKDDAARDKMLTCYEEVVRLDPTTQHGIGAAKYHQYWNPNSYYTIKDHFYDAYCMTHNFDKEWRMDITDDVKAGAGTYTVQLIPYADGPVITRDYRFYVDGKEVSNNGDPSVSTKTAELTLPDVPAGAKVELRLIAQCRDHWMGPCGRIEVKAKR